MRTLRVQPRYGSGSRRFDLHPEEGIQFPIDAEEIQEFDTPYSGELLHPQLISGFIWLGLFIGLLWLKQSPEVAMGIAVITSVAALFWLIRVDEKFSRNRRIILYYKNGGIERFRINPSERDEILSILYKYSSTQRVGPQARMDFSRRHLK